MTSHADCRMYESKYPDVDDVVMVQVKSIAEMGAYVSLLEYNGIEGMILLSELSRRRIRSITKLIKVINEVQQQHSFILIAPCAWQASLIHVRCRERCTRKTDRNLARSAQLLYTAVWEWCHTSSGKIQVTLMMQVGRQEPVMVLRVDKEKGYIDLSKRRVSPEDVAACDERFSKSKMVHSIMRHVAETTGQDVEELYKYIAWPLYKAYGHAFDAFKVGALCIAILILAYYLYIVVSKYDCIMLGCLQVSVKNLYKLRGVCVTHEKTCACIAQSGYH